MIPENDLQEIATGRLARQYGDSPKLKALMALFITECELIRDAALSLEGLRTIDTSEGDGLDVIGEILGQPRELSGVVDVDYFELHDGTGGPAAEGLGDITDASAGLRLRSINESPTANALLGDAEYRRLLESKISRNYTSATPEQIIASIRSVLVDDPLVQLTFASGAVTATVQRVLSAEEQLLLNAESGIRGQIPVIARPIGISLTVAGL